MAYEELKDLIEQLDASSLTYLQYESGEEQIVLSKELPQFTSASQPVQPVAASQVISAEGQATSPSSATAVDVEEESPAASQAAGETVDSPMVGVAYLQPKPGADPYVQVGDQVSEGQVIMIIEAMKLMNEIQADKSGVVTEILVANEEVVEYGQPLIRID